MINNNINNNIPWQTKARLIQLRMDIQQWQQQHSSQLQLQWIGLRPSQVQQLNLPKSAFQQLCRVDKKRLESLLVINHHFERQGWDPQQRRIELEAMKQFKVQLEALHSLGMDCLSNVVVSTIQVQKQVRQQPNRRMMISAIPRIQEECPYLSLLQQKLFQDHHDIIIFG